MTAPSMEAERPKKRTWKYRDAAQAYREASGDPFYTMVWNAQFDTLIANQTVPFYSRGMAWILRTANGNLSPCCVDNMPKVDDRDAVPRRLGQGDLAAAIGCSLATASGLLRAYRECGFVLPETDGIYPNPCVQPDLFDALRQNADVNPLDLSRTSGLENPLQPFQAWRDAFRAQHPDHAAALQRIDQEIERLKELMADQRDARGDLELRELAAYRTYKRTTERAQRNGTSDSNNSDHVESEIHSTTPPERVDLRTAEEKIQDSTRENEVNYSGINEAAAEPLNLNTVASSSSGSNAESATTTTVDTPVSHQEGSAKPTPTTAVAHEDTPSKAGISDVEFHQALSTAFRDARKNIPTPSQSAACYAAVGRHATEFLSWLAGGPDHPPKLPSVRHPGVLLSLVEEFESWTCAGPPPAPPAPPRDPAEDEERRLMVEYAEFCAAEAFRLFAAIPDLVLRGLIDEKHKFLRREGRLDRMSLDARRREAENLILQDIEREQVMPFDEWVALKRKQRASL